MCSGFGLQSPTRWGVVVTLAGNMLVLSGSIVYHSNMNRCDCQREYRECLNYDVAGVICSFALTAISPITAGFSCASSMAVLLVLVSLAAMAWTAYSHALRESATVETRGKCLGSFAVARTLFVVLMVPDMNRKYHLHALCALVVGGVINAARIPERYLKGESWHYVGNSHQIWHCLSAYSCMVTYYSSLWDASQIDQC